MRSFVLSGLATFLSLPTAAAITCGSSLAQKEILYLKFNAGGGKKVINYAAGTPAPGEGTITSTIPAAQGPWAPGKHGKIALDSGLRGAQRNVTYNYVDTAWDGAFKGSFTVAFFMKLRNPLPGVNDLSYVFSGVNGFRMFTRGVAGTGLMCRAWGGPDLTLARDVHAASKGKWLHIALVVDDAAGKANYYMDGTAVPGISFPPNSANVARGTRNFRVGLHTSTLSSWAFDTDEFRFLLRAVPAAQILAWSRTATAADGLFSKACGAKLASSNGPPTLGNRLYRYAIKGNRGAPVLLSIGFSRTKLLGVAPLPIDLGIIWNSLKGCPWESSFDLILSGVTNASGDAILPFPIPPAPALKELTLYNQALLLRGPQSSNGLSSNIN